MNKKLYTPSRAVVRDVVEEALETIARGNTDPDEMVSIAKNALDHLRTLPKGDI